MRKKRVLIVGNGMAGLRLVEEMVTVAAELCEITVVGAEPEPAYNRVLLSSLLAGEIGSQDVRMRPRAWYDENGIKLITGTAVEAIHRDVRIARLSNGESLAFDHCVLATGSEAIRLPLPGAELKGVVTFRTLQDIDKLTSAAKAGKPAVVIGGGLLGIEAAYGLARAGVKVTLIHLVDRLMERQLDSEAAALVRTALEAHGIEVLLNAATERIEGRTSVTHLSLVDGRRIACGLVVMAVGVRPNVELARASGLAVKRGIVVDDAMQSSDEGISAVGECAEHRGVVYGLVEPAYEQAAVLARVLGGQDACYGGSILATRLKVSGVPVFSAGDFEGVGAECVILRDSSGPSYRKLVIRDGRLCGAVLAGDTAEASWYLELIRNGRSVTNLRAALPFGSELAEAA